QGSRLKSHVSRILLVLPHQRHQWLEFRIFCSGLVYVAEEARGFRQVFRLAVAVVEAREDADDLEMSLQTHPVEGATKTLRQLQAGGTRTFPVLLQPCIDTVFRPGKK